MWIFQKPDRRMFLDWHGYLVGIGLVALITLLKYLAQSVIPASISHPYMLAIVPTAIYFGLGPAVLTSILSVLAYEFFFSLPVPSSSSTTMQTFWVLIVFLTVGITVSFLASSLLHKTEEARRLNVKLIKSQEEERKRIARELHDDASPSLAYLGLELDAVTTKYPALSEEILQRLRKVRENLNNIQQDIRRYSHELHPAMLDNLGLEPTLETLVAELNSKKRMEIRFDVCGTARKLSDEVNLALYRITQEALNNIWKHSMATKALVCLEYRLNKVFLSVADNGVGFDTLLQTAGTLGLTSMRERASQVNARLKLESAAGRGTKISVEVNA